MSGVELLPCPFCGGVGDIESQPSYSQAANTYGRYRGWCDICGFGLDWHSHEADAIAAWNSRTPAQPMDAATIERCADEIGRRIAERNGGLGINGSVYAAATVGAREALAHNTASHTTRGEDARLREALERIADEHTERDWIECCEIARASLQGDAAHTSQENPA